MIQVQTGSRETVADITGECAEFARSASGGGDGLLHVFVPHATAGIALIELGSGSDTDLLAALADLLPADDRWRHAHGSRGHGRSHVLPGVRGAVRDDPGARRPARARHLAVDRARGRERRTIRTGRCGCRSWPAEGEWRGSRLSLPFQ